jgi:GDP-mannose transporter
MSRPTTPLGLSPRGSFVNINHAALVDSAPGTPRDEKDRWRAEDEVRQALLKADGLEKAKKEDLTLPVGSPGESIVCFVGADLTETCSLAHIELLYCFDHDDRSQQVRRFRTSIHNDFPA